MRLESLLKWYLILFQLQILRLIAIAGLLPSSRASSRIIFGEWVGGKGNQFEPILGFNRSL